MRLKLSVVHVTDQDREDPLPESFSVNFSKQILEVLDLSFFADARNEMAIHVKK